jgi:hypothetical protein
MLSIRLGTQLVLNSMMQRADGNRGLRVTLAAISRCALDSVP